LYRTRISRLVLDARLGIVSERVRAYMSNGKNVLEDDDLAMLRALPELRSSMDKLERAKELAAEAHAEIAAVMGGFVNGAPAKKAKKTKPAKTPKKTKKTPKIEFKASGNALTENEEAVLAVVKKGNLKMPEIIEKTGLTPSRAKAATRGLKDRKLIVLDGFGPTSVWKAA
jgi:hypothetical protein